MARVHTRAVGGQARTSAISFVAVGSAAGATTDLR
jgi:hypothetical protein